MTIAASNSAEPSSSFQILHINLIQVKGVAVLSDRVGLDHKWRHYRDR